MAASLPRILSFGKNTKALLDGLRLAAAPAQQYSVQVSNYGEKITHTGQVRHSLIHVCLSLLAFVVRIDTPVLYN